jgi:hypothetical protein
MALDELLNKGKKLLLLGLTAAVISSCSTPPIRAVPSPTAAEKPAASATYTLSPAPVYTATPTFYPTIDASMLPPILQEFLSRYDTFEEMDAGIRGDYSWRDGILKWNSSPAKSLELKIGDCSETSLISALFGEKLGFYPYQLALTYTDEVGNIDGHAIHVFQDPITQFWGYNDGLSELKNPSFSSISELANMYIKTHPFSGGEYYDNWYLVDLNKIAEVYSGNRDWRTLPDSVPIGAKTFIDSGKYNH